MLTVSKQDTLKEWIMDSGCSFHSTPVKEVLFDFKEYDGGSVLMANNTKGSIKGMGKIRIQNPDGSEVILKDVRYMPEVRRNLISYGMLEKSGCNYEGRGYMVRFYKGRKKVLAGKYKDGLYYLQGNVSKSEENVLGVVEEVRKKKSTKVTFMENLIQGPTPHGFGTRELLVQGGDSVSKESRSSEETKSEKSCEESKSKDSDFVAYGLAAAEKTDSKESKMNEGS